MYGIFGYKKSLVVLHTTYQNYPTNTLQGGGQKLTITSTLSTQTTDLKWSLTWLCWANYTLLLYHASGSIAPVGNSQTVQVVYFLFLCITEMCPHLPRVCPCLYDVFPVMVSLNPASPVLWKEGIKTDNEKQRWPHYAYFAFIYVFRRVPYSECKFLKRE